MVKEKEIKDWYNQRHHSFGSDAWRPYEAYPIFLEHLNVVSGRRLLDIGCGTGYLLRAANERGLETYGVDISDEGVKIAKMNSPTSKIAVGKGEDLGFPDGTFDYVTCLGALEHFLDIDKGVREMVRVAKKDASLCIMVPNTDFLLWKIRGTKGTEQQDINENLLSLKQWENIFTREGLDVSNIYPDEWYMKKIRIFSSANPISIIRRTVYKLLWTVLPLKYTYQFIFVLRRK